MGVRLLLGTHALVWWWQSDARLPTRAAEAIAREETKVFVSAVTAWETATKYRIGKWPDVGVIIDGFETLLSKSRFIPLAVTAAHARLAGSLRGDHRDPFDRLIVAQAKAEALTIVSGDDALRQFEVPLLWSDALP